MKIRLQHGFYGCDTGCCGTAAIDEDGEDVGWSFFEPSDNSVSAEDFAWEEFRKLCDGDNEFEWDDSCGWCHRTSENS